MIESQSKIPWINRFRLGTFFADAGVLVEARVKADLDSHTFDSPKWDVWAHVVRDCARISAQKELDQVKIDHYLLLKLPTGVLRIISGRLI